MVVAVMAILTAAVLPWAESSSQETLAAAAQSVSTDLAYARSLAVTNNSNYAVHFDVAQNRYVLQHAGLNEALNTLPNSVFRNPGDPPDAHIVNLDALPGIGQPVRLAGVFRVDGGTAQSITDVEFGPLGEITASGYSVVVLTLKSGIWTHHALVLVNPVTGLATVHPDLEDLPSDLSSTSVEEVIDTL